jgi:hypothetical protein
LRSLVVWFGAVGCCTSLRYVRLRRHLVERPVELLVERFSCLALVGPRWAGVNQLFRVGEADPDRAYQSLDRLALVEALGAKEGDHLVHGRAAGELRADRGYHRIERIVVVHAGSVARSAWESY